MAIGTFTGISHFGIGIGTELDWTWVSTKSKKIAGEEGTSGFLFISSSKRASERILTTNGRESDESIKQAGKQASRERIQKLDYRITLCRVSLFFLRILCRRLFSSSFILLILHQIFVLSSILYILASCPVL